MTRCWIFWLIFYHKLTFLFGKNLFSLNLQFLFLLWILWYIPFLDVILQVNISISQFVVFLFLKLSIIVFIHQILRFQSMFFQFNLSWSQYSKRCMHFQNCKKLDIQIPKMCTCTVLYNDDFGNKSSKILKIYYQYYLKN